MAISNLPKVSYDFSSNRAAVTGDIRKFTSQRTFDEIYQIYDGKDWKDIDLNTNRIAHSINGGNITSNGSTTYNSNIAALGTVKRQVDDNFKEDFFAFMKENLRVAEYVDDSGKIEYVQLQFRTGPGYVWEEVRRIRLKPTDKPF
jgi:hypothetical protein